MGPYMGSSAMSEQSAYGDVLSTISGRSPDGIRYSLCIF
jgi:hypothetical protein